MKGATTMKIPVPNKGNIQLLSARAPDGVVADVTVEVHGGAIQVLVARWEGVEMPVQVTVV